MKLLQRDFQKLDQKAELTEENLEDIISESISYMEKRFSKNIRFDQQSNLIDKKLKINKVLMIWVIENICKNAADAMKGEGLIRIKCMDYEKNVQIFISDTGSGIDKSIVKSIFMPGITSKKEDGDLDYPLVKRIIEDYHKGKIFCSKIK